MPTWPVGNPAAASKSSLPEIRPCSDWAVSRDEADAALTNSKTDAAVGCEITHLITIRPGSHCEMARPRTSALAAAEIRLFSSSGAGCSPVTSRMACSSRVS